MKVLGVIPARGGSKGVPRKNLADVNGRPLIAYTIDSALAASDLADVVVSTDDQEIATIAKACGARVPFVRPAHLAADDTPTIDVLVHLCQTLAEKGESYDAICLLQPTSPQRDDTLIDDCVEQFRNSQADALVTVASVPHHYNPHWVFWKADDGKLRLSTGEAEPIIRRQLLPPAFIRDGCIYITKTDVIVNKRSLYGESVVGFERPSGINIDTIEDLEAFRSYIGTQQK